MKRFVVALVLAGCTARSELPPVDPGLGALALGEVHPALILPSSRIDVVGAGFPEAALGETRLELVGRFEDADVQLTLPANVVDEQHLYAVANEAFFAVLPARTGHFAGTARVVVDSTIDLQTHGTAARDVAFDVAETLMPQLDRVNGGLRYVNEGIVLDGDGFLLGGGEGDTHAMVSGCFLPSTAPAGAVCSTAGKTVKDIDVLARPAMPWDRAQALFAFAPAIAGIHPGKFVGTVRLENRLAGGDLHATANLAFTVTLRKPAVATVSPIAASLGQYVDIAGGGFVGADSDEVTLLQLKGTFTPTGGKGAPVDLKLVPHFVDGANARYVLDETDALGKVLDLRRAAGQFAGTVTPIVRKGTDEEIGLPTTIALVIAPVKQVVYVRFLPSYVDSLRLYGLTALDRAIRQRVLAVAARDYAGVNIEFRDSVPTDFALYSQVDVAGADPNNLGLLGYDNTPGKDVGNERLFDRLGGVNATTQSDGYPGFGGVFTEQFLGFSAHPDSAVEKLPVDSSLFDDIFDRVRPGLGRPVSAAEGLAGIAQLPDGNICPANPNDRPAVLACAVFVLGNLIGGTLTHEVGHSLGLADPTGELFHDPGDELNRLMDSGDARPLEERAELMRLGPGVFCDDEYVYLRTILPTLTDAPTVARPACN